MRLWAYRHRAAARRHARDAGAHIARHIVEQLPLRAPETIGGYWPVRGEADPLPAMLALLARGHRLALPVVVGAGTALIFRRWQPGAPLVVGPFGIPAPGIGAAPVTPTLLLVPGLWFDRAGGRLGYGGGFYDRTLAGLRAGRAVTAVGVAYGAQVGGGLDREAHDAPMDWIVTQQRVIRTCAKGCEH